MFFFFLKKKVLDHSLWSQAHIKELTFWYKFIFTTYEKRSVNNLLQSGDG